MDPAHNEPYVFKKDLPAFDGITRADFLRYLTSVQLCDGTKSPAPAKDLAGAPIGTIKELFANDPPEAATFIHGKQGTLWTFFNPDYLHEQGINSDQFFQAMIFHEGLHGYTKLGDGRSGSGLCQLLGVAGDRPDTDTDCPVNSTRITDWLRNLMYP